MSIHVEAIEDHVAEMTREFSVSWPEPCLQRLEVRLAFVVDDDDLTIEEDRDGEVSERMPKDRTQVAGLPPIAACTPVLQTRAGLP